MSAETPISDAAMAKGELLTISEQCCIVYEEAQRLERILNAVRRYPYLPAGLAQVIEDMENAPH